MAIHQDWLRVKSATSREPRPCKLLNLAHPQASRQEKTGELGEPFRTTKLLQQFSSE
jgi:hypothetical protein